MASNFPTDNLHNDDDDQHVDEGEQFISNEDILDVIEDDGDHPMDDDDDGEDGDGDEEMMAEDEVAPEDTSVSHFPTHNGSVFTVTTHPSQLIAASGGEDDLGYLWNIESGEVLVKLTGHSDSVTSIAFSSDGELVATGAMDGKVRIWRRVGKNGWRVWEFLTELQGPDEVMWLRWHPRGPVLLAGSNDSTVWLWQLPSGNTMQVFAGHGGPVQCGEFTPDGKRIITADDTGGLIVWDPRSPNPVFKLSPSDARFALEGGITSLAVNHSSTIAVVGGAAGGLRAINLSKGEVIGALEGHREGESVESVVFVDLVGAGASGSGAPGGGSGVVVTGSTDGKACIWDLSTMRLRATLEHEDAVTTLLPHPSPKNHLLTSGSADKTLRTWDARTGKLLKEHKGHRGPVLGASLSFDGSVVVSAGDDGVCLVFETE